MRLIEKFKEWLEDIIRCPSCSSKETKLIDTQFYGYMFGAGLMKIYECKKCYTEFSK